MSKGKSPTMWIKLREIFIFKMGNVIIIVSKVVNFIRSKGNNFHKFKDFLADMGYEN